ncbi:Mbov_0397 family ICE element conjugal transfer ATPase [Mycoplasmopsis primatum]|uniref:Mbov_0397 family ICE element conjugal transfer ATPase n=1 Tax=Mycoplasmopsis primatum TaxID=55604 RepID=UPI0004960259|nr:conjugal transfer protein TraE [Mycoplasmopsis primatum]
MLQPKNIKKQKGKVFKDFTYFDFGIIMINILLAFSIGNLLIPSIAGKIGNFIISLITFGFLSTVLIKSSKYNCRLYVLFFRMIKFLFRIKKYKKDSAANNTKLLIPYSELIDDKIIKTKRLKAGFKYFSVIKFLGKSPWGENNDDKDAFIKRWNDVLDGVEVHLSIVRLKELMDYTSNFNSVKTHMERKMARLDETDADLEVRDNYLNYYESRIKDFDLLDNHLLIDTYYVVLYAKNTNNLNKNIYMFLDSMRNLGLDADIVEGRQLIEFLGALNDKVLDADEVDTFIKNSYDNTLRRHNNDDDIVEKNDLILTIKNFFKGLFEKIKKWKFKKSAPVPAAVEGEKDKGEVKEPEKEKVLKLDDLLANDEIVFKAKYFIKDGMYYSIQTISDLPLNLVENWTYSFFNNDSRVVWQLSPWTEDFQALLLDKTAKKITDNAGMTKSQYGKKSSNLQLEALEYLENQLQVNGNLLFSSSLLVINKAESLKELKKIENKIAYECKRDKLVLNPLPFKQFEAYSQICLITTNNLNEDVQMSSENIAYGWNFDNETNNDGNTFLLGETAATTEPIIFNQFKKSQKRTNFNMFTVGSSGKGKSTDVKKAIVGHLAENNKVYVIDVQNEYGDVGRAFGASTIDLGAGYKTVINPLEIQILLNDENDDYSVNLVINKHIEWLEQFFKLVNPEFSTEHLIFIMRCVIDLYRDLGFYKLKNADDLKKKKFPIMSDLIKKIKKYKFVDDFERARKENMVAMVAETLEYLFEHNGKYEALYNGETNINLDNDFIIFNTQKLANDDSNSSKVGLYILLSFIQNKVFNNYLLDKNSNTVIVIDELHIYIDPSNMTTLNFVYLMTKTVRKFNAGMILCTQNPSDFLGSLNVTSKAQAILQNCQYAKFFGLKSKDLEAVVEMFKYAGGLNKSQTSYLLDSNRGNLIFSLHLYSKIKGSIYYNDFEKENYFVYKE